MSDEKLREAAKCAATGWEESDEELFIRGARWQREQLRCATCKYFGTDYAGLHCLRGVDWPGDYDDFGCALHEQKEEHEAKKES